MPKKKTKEEPLKVNATFEQIIKASVSGNLKPKQKKKVNGGSSQRT